MMPNGLAIHYVSSPNIRLGSLYVVSTNQIDSHHLSGSLQAQLRRMPAHTQADIISKQGSAGND